MNVSWQEVKQKLAHRKIGTRNGPLEKGEICPGLTYEQHAESLAMWDMNRDGWAGSDWKRLLPELSSAYLIDLQEDLSILQPVEES